MSTAPETFNQTTVRGPSGRSREDRRSADHGYRARQQSAPGPPSEKRFFRIARLGDTAIGVVALLGGFLAATTDRMPAGVQEFLAIRLTVRNILLVLGYTVVWRLICVLFGLYNERRTRNRRPEALRVIGAVTSASAVALIFPLISVTHAFGLVLYFWIGSTASMLLLRAVLRALLTAPSHKTQDVLVVGSGPRALSLYYRLGGALPNGRRVLGFVDSSNAEMAPEVRNRLLGDLASLEEILMRRAVDEVLIALPVRSRYAEIQRAIEICERGGVPARYLADVFQHRRHCEQRPLAEPLSSALVHADFQNDRLVFKRWLDLSMGGLLFVGALPVLAVAALAIKLTSPGPILFTQERYGLNKRRFKMYKLRTMVSGAEAQQELLEASNEASGPVFKIRADPRITPVGRLLRRLSIDELPQLINVLRGEMSLVGPRPLPERDVSRFSQPTLMRRFSVYPGITGLWQVSGRSELTFDDWIRLDLQYIDQWSLHLDLQILLRTVPAVIHGRGAV
jgi:exopolysaccharide biosynthesis polyprenyl glycosylphosphotransferase